MPASLPFSFFMKAGQALSHGLPLFFDERTASLRASAVMKRPAPLTEDDAAARIRTFGRRACQRRRRARARVGAFCCRAWSLWCMRRAADRVYAELGWGWGESTYREAMAVELQRRGFRAQQEIVAPIMYRGQALSHTSIRMDLVVRDRRGCWLLELKAVAAATAAAAMAKACQQCARYRSQVQQLRAAMVLVFPDKAGQNVHHALA